VIYTWSGADVGDLPLFGGVIQGSSGLLYGTAYGSSVFSLTTTGSGETEVPVIQYGCDDGNFYGTTLAGGTPNANCKASNGCGTLYRMTPSGTETVLYSFGTNASDGIGPSGALLQASDGNLYGTTTAGGTANAGTVFKLVLGTN
jgi:uncharacterized repeat protein (TIGR03803 family)